MVSNEPQGKCSYSLHIQCTPTCRRPNASAFLKCVISVRTTLWLPGQMSEWKWVQKDSRRCSSLQQWQSVAVLAGFLITKCKSSSSHPRSTRGWSSYYVYSLHISLEARELLRLGRTSLWKAGTVSWDTCIPEVFLKGRHLGDGQWQSQYHCHWWSSVNMLELFALSVADRPLVNFWTFWPGL